MVETNIETTMVERPIAQVGGERPIAFVGAEGFGAYAQGGRGGRVIEVTNLNDSGPGSFRGALEAEGPRTVVFRVSGTIRLLGSIHVMNPFLTIAGQTAPGEGITIQSDPANWLAPVSIRTHDVVVQHMRFRPGAPSLAGRGGRQDAIELYGAYDVILDHISASWATDQVLTIHGGSHDITVQWSVISEGLLESTYPDGEHSTGSLTEANDVTFHHNLFAHNKTRNPRVTARPEFFDESDEVTYDIRNNVIYNWGRGAIEIGGLARANVIGNYFKPGPSTDRATLYPVQLLSNGYEDFDHLLGAGLFIDGNVHTSMNCGPICPEQWVLVTGSPNSVEDRSSLVFNAPPVTTTSAFEAYDQVLGGAGARPEARDAVDIRLISDVVNGTGHFIDEPGQVGGWPVLAGGEVPADTDHDGIPDFWEEQRGLDPRNPSDAAVDSDGDGFTHLEEYLQNDVRIREPIANPPPEEIVLKAMDRDGDGLLEAPEVTSYMENLSKALGNPEQAGILSELFDFDVDLDGQVSVADAFLAAGIVPSLMEATQSEMLGAFQELDRDHDYRLTVYEAFSGIDDLILYMKRYGTIRSSDPRYRLELDFNRDGVIDGSDLICLFF